MEFLTAREAQEAIVANSEFAANPDVAAGRAHPRLGGRQDRPDRRRARRPGARGRGRAHAARRVEVAAPAAAAAPGWTVAGDRSSPLLVAGPLLALPASFLGRGRGVRPDRRRACCPRRCARASCSPPASAPARCARRRAGRARLVLRLPRPPLARLGARAAARDARPTCSSSCCSASTTRPARCSARCAPSSATARAARHPHHGRDDRRAHARALPVRLHARPQRVPRPVAPGARGGAHARALLRRARCAASRCRSPARRSPPASRSR